MRCKALKSKRIGALGEVATGSRLRLTKNSEF